jgi:hypothetical protein
MAGFTGMLRGLMGANVSESEKQLALFRGLFSGMPQDEFSAASLRDWRLAVSSSTGLLCLRCGIRLRWRG